MERVTRLIAVMVTRSATSRCPEYADAAADQAVPADARAARDRRATGHRGVRADENVVRDLDLVVQPHVFFQHGVFQRAAVDRGVGADLAIVAHAHAAELRHLDPAAVVVGDPETIGADHRAGMDQHALAEPDARHQGDARDEARLRAHAAVVSDDAMRAEHGAVLDHCASCDVAERADAGARGDVRSGFDDDTRMHAWCGGGLSFEQRRDPRIREVGILGEQHCRRALACAFLAQHHHARARVAQRARITGIREEGELVGRRRRKRADAADQDVVASARLQTEAPRQFIEVICRIAAHERSRRFIAEPMHADADRRADPARNESGAIVRCRCNVRNVSVALSIA